MADSVEAAAPVQSGLKDRFRWEFSPSRKIEDPYGRQLVGCLAFEGWDPQRVVGVVIGADPGSLRFHR